MWHYRGLVNKRPGRAAGEETQHAANEINSVILDWVQTSDFKGQFDLFWLRQCLYRNGSKHLWVNYKHKAAILLSLLNKSFRV